jgi:cyclophilin family peptidyl-prolyl cis-trans isomerase
MHFGLQVTIAVAAAIVVVGTPALSAAGSSTIELVAEQGVYYEGDTVRVAIRATNPGDRPARNPIDRSAAAALVVLDSTGQAVEPEVRLVTDAASAPRRLEPGGVHESVLEIDLPAQPGSYEISWTAGGHAAPPIDVHVLSRFDWSRRYVAHVETDYGSIEIRLLPAVSPLAVKAFVDLARAGFYDGSRFHDVQADSHIAVGDPRFGSKKQTPFAFPAEQSDLVVIPGTVVLKPVGPAPPTNGSEFIISMRPRPAWTGQVTVLGQVARGMEVVQRISRVPTARVGSRPGPRPVKPIRILRVTITSELPVPSGS